LVKINYKVKYEYQNWLSILDKSSSQLKDENFNFNIPLYILYSSGTTGDPKCIVHGAGGSLIQHKKEHQLHCNIKPNDKVFYFTTCGWMMWNWLVSCLASEATIYLYDGSPFFPAIDYLFEIINEENITYFGTSAKYLDTLNQNKINIKNNYNLEKLRTIASTGSPLIHETFKYVYQNIKKDVHLTSICGGTDIVSCFVLGNPNFPVYAGEIQCKGLGMDVAVFDNAGNSLKGEKGELVCLTPFPSKPIYFWNDDKNKKLKKTYFSKYSNIWHHGDFAEISINDGIIIYGRSDATLNSSGIRIGTAELYRIVDDINDILECIAAEQKYNNDNRIILFVKLNKNKTLDKKLINLIKYKIKNLLSPKHVPSKIIQVSDIPRTKNGKLVEITIKKILNNERITNINSLANPECLDDYRNRRELQN
jgi:acetoacetyl-CoA synthetase